MEKIKKIIIEKKISEVSDYFNTYKMIEQEIEIRKLQSDKNIKIALLSSFTTNGIKEVLTVKCCEMEILPEFYVAEYNQYLQEILNTDSQLYKFSPELVIIFIETRTILGEDNLLFYQLSDIERKEWVNKKLNEIQSMIQKIKEKTSAKILLHNFEVPCYSPLGIHENKQKFGFIESIEEVNSNLRDVFKSDSQVFIFDYDCFCSKIGKQNIIDYKMYYLADIRLKIKYIPNLCDDYLSFIKPIVSITKKCIVLDLDNTLWGGVIGEDGLEGIKLGPTVQGRPYWDFQKYLHSLYKRGVILAINSMNNYDDVEKVFQECPYMVLKKEHFAAIQINWNDKISNMKAIAEIININLDSMVFIDDDMLNTEMVRSALPQVKVIDLPKDPSLYLKKLSEINDFNTLQITEEDKKKGEFYAQQRKREDLQKDISNVEKYLNVLEMHVVIEKANPFSISRISQLTQKTNQFNMTTRRYKEEEVKKFSESDKFLIATVQVRDKFGDNGIAGATIVEKSFQKWRIDLFLLSCRIINRKIEQVLLGYILKQAKKERARTLIGEFVSTKKNIPATDFFKNNNFKFISKNSNTEIWEYDTDLDYKIPSFFTVIEKG